METVKKYLTCSNISVIIRLNPVLWAYIPFAHHVHDEWKGPNEFNFAFGWLFLTIKIRIDDGSW